MSLLFCSLSDRRVHHNRSRGTSSAAFCTPAGVFGISQKHLKREEGYCYFGVFFPQQAQR